MRIDGNVITRRIGEFEVGGNIVVLNTLDLSDNDIINVGSIVFRDLSGSAGSLQYFGETQTFVLSSNLYVDGVMTSRELNGPSGESIIINTSLDMSNHDINNVGNLRFTPYASISYVSFDGVDYITVNALAQVLNTMIIYDSGGNDPTIHLRKYDGTTASVVFDGTTIFIGASTSLQNHALTDVFSLNVGTINVANTSNLLAVLPFSQFGDIIDAGSTGEVFFSVPFATDAYSVQLTYTSSGAYGVPYISGRYVSSFTYVADAGQHLCWTATGYIN